MSLEKDEEQQSEQSDVQAAPSQPILAQVPDQLLFVHQVWKFEKKRF